ncbi:MAG: DUF86 domain-containing protein [Nitrospinae bacterium]|nr:DUF86 domain-containing protein [Nitrospinota bacterium]
MSPPEQISLKIEKVRGYIAELSYFRAITVSELASDKRAMAAMERFLYLICDSVISLAEMLVAARGFEHAESYGENADILLSHGEITAEESEALHRITGLRNVLSHDYEKLNLEILKNVVDKKLSEIEGIVNTFSKK